MLTVTTAAADRSLLTIAEMRAAVGISDASQDTELAALSSRIASSLARQCCVPVGGIVPPTFRLETLTEVIRDNYWSMHLTMGRKPIVSVASIVEDGTTLTTDDYEIDSGAGRIYKLTDDARTYWSGEKITVVYDAGWDTVPDDLKLAAAKMAKMIWSEDARSDPNLKRHRIDGVGEREYWVPPDADALLSAEIRDLIVPYVYRMI